jgi:leader peptidase (prepilin peptidase) / N-methyltransferase
VLFIACWFSFRPVWTGAVWAVFCFLLVGLAAMDAETMLLPDRFTIPGMVLGVFVAGVRGDVTKSGFETHAALRSAGESLLSACVAAGFLLLISGAYWLVRRQQGLGMGDVKLMALLGAWLGTPRTALALVIAVVFGSAYGLALLAAPRSTKKGTAASTAIPFGTFLCLAGIYSLFLGERTLRWYLQFFR